MRKTSISARYGHGARNGTKPFMLPFAFLEDTLHNMSAAEVLALAVPTSPGSGSCRKQEST